MKGHAQQIVATRLYARRSRLARLLCKRAGQCEPDVSATEHCISEEACPRILTSSEGNDHLLYASLIMRREVRVCGWMFGVMVRKAKWREQGRSRDDCFSSSSAMRTDVVERADQTRFASSSHFLLAPHHISKLLSSTSSTRRPSCQKHPPPTVHARSGQRRHRLQSGVTSMTSGRCAVKPDHRWQPSMAW